MKNRKVRNFAEFALWTKTRMLERGISQRELAAGMGTHQARISEAIAQNKKDTLFPNVSIDIGDEIIMQDDAENNIFGGIIFDADKKGSSKTVSYLAYDLLFYVNQSDVNMVFSGTPESIVTQICQKLDIPCGELAPTNGVVVKSPCFGKKAYKARECG